MPNKVFSKGDGMELLPQKTSMGGGGSSDISTYRGSIPRRMPVPDIDGSDFSPYQGPLKIDKSNIGNSKSEDVARAITMGISAGGIGASAKFAKDAYDFQDKQKIRKNVRKKVTDRNPSVNIRKAYEE